MNLLKIWTEIVLVHSWISCPKYASKVKIYQACSFIEKRLQHRCFPVNIKKFLRTPAFSKITSGWLLLIVVIYCIKNWIKLFRNQIDHLFHWEKSHYFTYSHLFSFVLSLAVNCCHSLSLVVPLAVTRCHSLYQSLSFVVTRCTTRCHSMYDSSVFF